MLLLLQISLAMVEQWKVANDDIIRLQIVKDETIIVKALQDVD